MMAVLALLWPLQISFVFSNSSTLALRRISSLAVPQPTTPPPTMITSYTPFTFPLLYKSSLAQPKAHFTARCQPVSF